MIFNNGTILTTTNKNYQVKFIESKQPKNTHNILQDAPTSISIHIIQNVTANTPGTYIAESKSRDIKFYPNNYDTCSGSDCDKCKRWYCVTVENNEKLCLLLTKAEVELYENYTEYDTEDECENLCYSIQSQYINIIP